MRVFVQGAAEPRSSSCVEARDPLRIVDRFGQRTQRAGVREALVRPVLVVENLELAQGVEEMALIPDQCPLQQLPAAGKARISTPFSRSLIGSSRRNANAFVMPRYASRNTTTTHHVAVIVLTWAHADVHRAAALRQPRQLLPPAWMRYSARAGPSSRWPPRRLSRACVRGCGRGAVRCRKEGRPGICFRSRLVLL